MRRPTGEVPETNRARRLHWSISSRLAPILKVRKDSSVFPGLGSFK